MALKRKRKRAVRTDVNTKHYPKLTLQQALDMVISGKTAEGVRERTLKDYVKMWGYFTDWLADHYEVEYVSELTAEMFRNYINYMKYDKRRYGNHPLINTENQTIGLKDTTININLRCLRSLFNHLEREELIEVNPMAKIRLLRTEVDLTNCFDDEEVKALFKQPDLRDYVGFRDYVGMNLLLDSGLRINEMLSLRVGNIDFKTRFITVESGRAKNRNARLVPISSHVTKLLLQLIEENNRHFKTDRIFLSCYGENLSDRQFTKRLKYYAEKAGIDGKKVTAHVYRHTWAKNMILNGCDPFTLQKLGGWADIRTMRRYIQMDTEEMRRSHDNYSPVMKMRKKRD